MCKKKTQFTIIYFIILVIVACSKLDGQSPNEVLNKYLDASTNGRHKEEYGYISSEDKAVKNFDTFLKENKKENSPFAKIIGEKISYKIIKINKFENKATAEVEITLPDFKLIFSDVMGAAFTSTFGGVDMDEKEIEKIIPKKIESGEVPLTTMKDTLNLVKEKDGWKVYLDWKTAKIKKENQTKIQALLGEAKELKKSKKLHGAVKKYEEILELDSEMVKAKEELKKSIKR